MAGFSFSNLFGGSSGPIAHGANGAVTQLPRENPQGNLSGQPQGQQAAAPAPAPAPVDPIHSQLDKLAPVWQNPTTADGKPVAPQVDPLKQQMFQFDPAKVAEGAAGLDFTSGIAPELLTKVVGDNGDPEALKQLLNAVVRTAFTANTVNTGNLLNDGFARHGQNIDQALPQRLRNMQVASARTQDPILSHPAVAPLFGAMKGVLAGKMQGATAEDVQQATEQYFAQIGQAYLAQHNKQEAVRTGEADTTDWLAYAGLK